MDTTPQRLLRGAGYVALAAAALASLPPLRARLRAAELRRLWEQHVTQWEGLTIQRHDVVLLGDSITAGGSWPELLPGVSVRNRGINGDQSTGVLRRLGPIIQGKPAKVFLLIGTNDISAGRDVAAVAADVDRILTELAEGTPDTELYVQSVMPRSKRLADRVRALNERYRALAERHGATYVDLWPELADAEGRLRREYSNDRLHLLGAGYEAWVRALRPHLGAAP